MRSYTLAIPYHGDRTKFLSETLRMIHDDERIARVVIRDDGSSIDDIDALHTLCSQFRKVEVLLGMKNVGPFQNKVKLLRSCLNQWTILLDSDNSITDQYLNALDNVSQEQTRIYCPESSLPELDYRDFKGMVFCENNLRKGGMWNKLLDNPKFTMMLNTGNYTIYPSENYPFRMRALEFLLSGDDPKAADVIYMNRYFMECGMNLHVVPGMTYIHRIHPGSTYLQMHKESAVFADKQIAAMKAW
jgi:glycosyltransferase involved in cell wall biosynthesis